MINNEANKHNVSYDRLELDRQMGNKIDVIFIP